MSLVETFSPFRFVKEVSGMLSPIKRGEMSVDCSAICPKLFVNPTDRKKRSVYIIFMLLLSENS
jgi:hypothetical protein